MPRFPVVRVLLLSSLLALVLAAPPALASTVRALDLAELTAQADVIVLGQVTERSARWGPRRRLILTDVAVRPERVLKGPRASGQDLVYTHLGGAIEGLGLEVPGAAKLAVGTRALLFLARHPATDELRAVGMSQGAVPVVLRDGADVVLGGSRGLALMRPGARDGRLHDAAPALPTDTPLSELLAQVAALVRAAGAP